jgi:hypothetical protein
MPYSYQTTDDNEFTPIRELEWHVSDSTVVNALDLTFEYFGATQYNQKPNFDYKIEFFDTPTNPSARVFPLNTCEDGTLLPFRIINLDTGKEVTLTHTDKGYTGEFDENTGYSDCNWTINEKITFSGDTLRLGVDGEESDYKTWNLTFDYFFDMAFPNIGWTEYEAGKIYNIGDVVFSEAMLWEATAQVVIPVSPGEFWDQDGDGLDDNPWKVMYPWNEGDYLIIRTNKFYQDGDSWLADMSKLGESHTVTQEELDRIRVVPNPYIVRSAFNESSHVRQLEFIHLPQRCTITIFTVTGEKVASFTHDDDYSDREFWNLRTVNNQEVAPGLYLYTVEAGGKTHIGKFAVVR